MPTEENVMAILSKAIEKQEESITVEAVSTDDPGNLPTFDAVDMDSDDGEETDGPEFISREFNGDDDEPEETEPDTSLTTDEQDEDDAPARISDLRKAYKDRKREARDWQKKFEALEAQSKSLQQQQAQNVRPQAPLPEPTRSTQLSAAEILEGYAKLENGDLEEKYRPQLAQFISELAPQELAQVQQQAMLGQLGEYNAEILQYAGQFMSLSQQNYTRRQQLAATEMQRKSIRETALAEVSRIEGIADPNSETGKRYRQTAMDLGDALGREVFENIPHAPLLVRDLVTLRDQAAMASRIPALEKENAESKARLARVTSPSRGGTGAKTVGSPKGENIVSNLRSAFRQAGNRNA